MATVKIDITRLIKKLDLTQQIVVDEANILIMQATDLGVEAARNKLRSSVTKHGRFRMSQNDGRGPGREKTGSMMDSITAYDPHIKGENYIAVRFGWGPGKMKKYFGFQDNGTSRIPAANSMATAVRAVKNELPRLERNMKQRIRARMAGNK